jgi:hypothetical protein
VTLEPLLLLSFVAGLVGAMAGMGGGVVLIHHLVMGLPPKVSTTTSNLIIGVTALPGTSVYLASGLIDTGLWHRLATGVATFDAPLGGTDALRPLVGDLRLAASGQLSARLLVSLGVAVLLFTPYLRVLASVVFFAAVERNWKYAVFTSFVLIVLTYSLLMR